MRCSDHPPPSSWLGQGLGLGFGSGSRRDLANATGLLPGPLPNTHSPVRTLSCPREAVEPIPGMRRPRLALLPPPSHRHPLHAAPVPFLARAPQAVPLRRKCPTAPRAAPRPAWPQASAPHCVRTPDMETCRTEPPPWGPCTPPSRTVLISLSSPSPGRGDSRHLPLDAPVWGLGSGEWGGLCSLLSAAGRHIRL